jgi:site-specific recombinase XerD
MVLSEAIERLITATIADGRSPRTARDYRQKLAGLAAFLGPDRDLASIEADDLRRFVASLRQRSERYTDHAFRDPVAGGLSPASVAGVVRAVKRLFSFLASDGVLASNPARALRTPKLPKGKEPKAASLDDFLAMLAATAGGEPGQLRDRALLLFLADTGARVGGLVGLRLADLDLEHGAAWVTEKGEKRRAVYLTPETVEALRAWLAVRPGGNGGAVFVTLEGNHHALTRDGVTQLLRRLKARAGIDGPANPHAFRHAFAREYLRAGGDLATLSDLLGHSDIGVTANSYAVFLPSELQARHAKFSPVAQLKRNGDLITQ